MSHDEAVAALEAAHKADAEDAARPLEMPNKPDAPVTPEGSVTPDATTVAADSENRADLNALLEGVDDPAARDAIERAYKSFQSGFTTKAQQLAEQRKEYEAFGTPEAIREALEFRSSIQDPNNWPELYKELSEGLDTLGLLPQPAVEPEPEITLPPLSELGEDLEVSPLVAHIEHLQSELNSFKSEREKERATASQQQYRNALIGELTRQENAILQANPHYTSADVEFIYELVPHYDGNLFNAQAAAENFAKARLERYLEQKTAIGDTPGIHPIGGTGVISDQPVKPETLSDKEIDASAVEYLKANGFEDN